MKRARDAGIDAFALNIGIDSYTDQQLDFAYQSAADNGMKVFISFDFNWFSTGNPTVVGQKIAKYGSKPGQLLVDGRVFASSFAGQGLDTAAVKSAAGSNVFFVPNYYPGASQNALDGAFNWMVSLSGLRDAGLELALIHKTGLAQRRQQQGSQARSVRQRRGRRQRLPRLAAAGQVVYGA